MKKVAKKKSKESISYFGFIAVLTVGILLTWEIPDRDLDVLSMLSHRSIITHSILFPFLMHFFLINKKENPNPYLAIFIIGFYLAIAMHLSADMHPKGWRGNAFIKLPGNSSIGEVPSFIWMGLNTIASIYFSTILLKKILNANKIINTKKYFISFLVLALLIGFIYTVNDEPAGREMEKLSTFVILLLPTFVFSVRKTTTGNLINFAGLKKLFKIILWLVIIGTIIILVFVGYEMSAEKEREDKIQQEKKTNYRRYSLYKDETRLCKNNIIKKFPKKKFKEFNVEEYTTDKNKTTYVKSLKMWMKYDGLILKNKTFKYVNCYIKVKPDQSINFVRIGDKY